MNRAGGDDTDADEISCEPRAIGSTIIARTHRGRVAVAQWWRSPQPNSAQSRRGPIVLGFRASFGGGASCGAAKISGPAAGLNVRQGDETYARRTE
jgi:hypothetical protein